MPVGQGTEGQCSRGFGYSDTQPGKASSDQSGQEQGLNNHYDIHEDVERRCDQDAEPGTDAVPGGGYGCGDNGKAHNAENDSAGGPGDNYLDFIHANI